MKPPTDNEKKIYDNLMAEMQKSGDAPEAEVKSKVAKRHGISVDDLDMIVVKVMSYAI